MSTQGGVRRASTSTGAAGTRTRAPRKTPQERLAALHIRRDKLQARMSARVTRLEYLGNLVFLRRGEYAESQLRRNDSIRRQIAKAAATQTRDTARLAKLHDQITTLAATLPAPGRRAPRRRAA